MYLGGRFPAADAYRMKVQSAPQIGAGARAAGV
jgi:hypothetical protein